MVIKIEFMVSKEYLEALDKAKVGESLFINNQVVNQIKNRVNFKNIIQKVDYNPRESEDIDKEQVKYSLEIGLIDLSSMVNIINALHDLNDINSVIGSERINQIAKTINNSLKKDDF